MHSTGFGFLDDDQHFEDRVLLLFDCNNCQRTVHNKSMNQHKASDCDKWRKQNFEFGKKMKMIFRDKDSEPDFF